jgi:hypothetical protein
VVSGQKDSVRWPPTTWSPTTLKNMAESDKDKLKKMIAWDAEPALTDGEVDELLGQSSVADSLGNTPSAVDWEPTYDLNTAAAAGWLVKAARAASLVEVDPPGSGLFTSKVFDNCRAMARVYSRKRVATVTTSTDLQQELPL